MAVDMFSVLSRIGAIAVALFVIATSIAMVAVINDNDTLVRIRDNEGPDDLLSENEKELQGLIFLTQGAAWWAIVICGFTIFVGVLSIIILFVNKQPTGKLVVGIIEIILMVLGVLCFMGLGIASAAYASRWGKPPGACAEYDTDLTLTNGDEEADVCDTNILSITTSLQSVFSFVEIGVFGSVILATVFTLLQSRSTTTNTLSWQEKS